MKQYILMVMSALSIQASLFAQQTTEEMIVPEQEMQTQELAEPIVMQMPHPAQIEPNIGLDLNQRKQVSDALRVLMADEYMLYLKTWKYHWNVRGINFSPLHKFFQKQYELLQGFVDEVAERIRQFGFQAPGTVSEFLQHTTLHEQPGNNPADLQMIANLLQDHETIIRNIRKYVDLTAQLNDMGTNNFLADLITKHEKMAWMLRAFLEK